MVDVLDKIPAAEAFARVFEGLPRQGPGLDCFAQSLALRLGKSLPHSPRIADMGCGNGRSSLVLAKSLGAHVIAVDLHRPFLEELERSAAVAGLSENIDVQAVDMVGSGLEEQSLDVVWSEGAAYVIGLENALDSWWSLLKPGGFLVLSDWMWLTARPPHDAEQFWKAAYPDMQTVSSAMVLGMGAGYSFVHAEILPEEGWWLDYYGPLEKRVEDLEADACTDQTLSAVIAGVRDEIATRRRFAGSYGCVYMILRRPVTGS
ncbi:MULTISPECIES: class I SAM-dependent methyltransferase [unclassified Haematospirillum]|uniref:class I SAM-dependent methyltransferase n=1 Tax=unclassified Haematospirillum TaxID=2622088 RepID=UPI00143BE79D|nr:MULTISPECIES: class I SAM-dependent methyltransferase [unclassified Haematospirillum]NKD54090.1 class I SAM-dependent methyltransferase [Haematospirillum sp. H4890]NKD74135.1 class I SAM-dependent methyltransferase [Haematospirillum sp. H4485]NKD87196.1 class I SAM-dependent methyltransferase [Haematospirillum sp. 15-248]